MKRHSSTVRRWFGLLVIGGLSACAKETPQPTGESVTRAEPSARSSATAEAALADVAAPPTGATATATAAANDASPRAANAAPVVAGSASAAGAASAAPTAEVVAVPVDGDKKTGAQYAAFLSGPKKVKVGSAVGLSATFTASGKYHCNEKYPTSFKPDAAPEGIAFASDKFTGAAFSTKRSTVPVTLTASSKGAKTVSGTLKFGVCDEAECVPVKAQVAFSFDVE
jgi:hypothetical protein